MFERGLDERPDDWSLRLVFADWLAEQGDTDGEVCQRWLARERKRPLSDYDTLFRKDLYGGHHYWGRYGNYRWTEWVPHCMLDPVLFKRVRDDYVDADIYWWREYPTRVGAEGALGRVLRGWLDGREGGL